MGNVSGLTIMTYFYLKDTQYYTYVKFHHVKKEQFARMLLKIKTILSVS